MKTVELFFDDLTEEAQQRVLEAAGMSSPAEGNWDVMPLADIDFEEEEPEKLCPKCQTVMQDTVSRIDGKLKEVYKCGNCEHTEVKEN